MWLIVACYARGFFGFSFGIVAAGIVEEKIYGVNFEATGRLHALPLLIFCLIVTLDYFLASKRKLGNLIIPLKYGVDNLFPTLRICISLAVCWMVAWIFLGKDEHVSLNIWSHKINGNVALKVLFFITVAALLEEVIFRGWALVGVRQITSVWSASFRVAGSAFVFSMAHLPNNWVVFASHGIMGLAYALIALRSQSLAVSLVVHVLWNLIVSPAGIPYHPDKIINPVLSCNAAIGQSCRIDVIALTASSLFLATLIVGLRKHGGLKCRTRSMR